MRGRGEVTNVTGNASSIALKGYLPYMTRTKTTKRIVPPPGHITDSPPSLCDAADALFRLAAECCRQHKRYSRLIDIAVTPEEQRAAASIVAVCDEQLGQLAEVYRAAVSQSKTDGDADWRHKANMLWHASREYLRHHRGADLSSRTLRNHSSEKLGELAVEYELEASALLALRHAVENYRKVRPIADGLADRGL
jgi:hypothetical protein